MSDNPPVQNYQALLKALNFYAPPDYLDFIFLNNVAFEGNNYCYLDNFGNCLFGASELIQINLDYNAAEFYSGYFLIGSDGCGEAYAIEKASGRFVQTPFIGHDEDTPIIIGHTWLEFINHLRDNAT